MYFKKIEGERIYLSPVDINDAEKYVKWLSDRSVTNGIRQTRKIINTVGEKEWLSKILEKGEYTFGIIDKNTDELIGNCGIMNVNEIDGTATLGIFIGEEDYRNKGIGKETLNLLLDFGFNQLRLHNIDLGVFSFNERAISCYKKIGFKEYGRRHEAYFMDGKWFDIIEMEMLEEDYKNKK
ncbi:MAG: GNAT family N-acetyltransferase [Bacilli bacterium]|nr:GNAT family N-acetyltransferase [Bacilli bacterium]